MEENQGEVVTFLVISAAIEWIEQHHINKKEKHERKIRAEKDAAEAILTVLLLYNLFEFLKTFILLYKIFFIIISVIRKSLWVLKLQWKISWLGKWNLMPLDFKAK